MIVASTYRDKTIGVFGLARSGLATIDSLVAAEAHVLAWDDNAANRESAADRCQSGGIAVADLYGEDFKQLDGLVIAPGVPLTHPTPHPLVEKAQLAKIPIFGDLEIFANAQKNLPEHNLVAITGTNGKSTTAALLASVLNTCGIESALGGNIGIPVLSLDPVKKGGAYIFEVSSFQIDLTNNFDANIAILLNVTPDHLDRHGDFAGYVRAKSRLFEMQSDRHIAIISIDDEVGQNLLKKLTSRVIPISTRQRVSNGVYVSEGRLIDALGLNDGEEELSFDISQFNRLRGLHNAQNISAAYAACRSLGLAGADIIRAIGKFEGLAHRLQVVRNFKGVTFINDSKASNSDAAEKALRAYNNIHWIAGGLFKEDNLDGLLDALPSVKKAYLIGAAAKKFEDLLDGKVPFEQCGNLNTAIEAALENATEGDCILLAPACASFDQYANFEKRGEHFIEIVSNLGGNA